MGYVPVCGDSGTPRHKLWQFLGTNIGPACHAIDCNCTYALEHYALYRVGIHACEMLQHLQTQYTGMRAIDMMTELTSPVGLKRQMPEGVAVRLLKEDRRPRGECWLLLHISSLWIRMFWVSFRFDATRQ